jgi:hypothetical protein
MKPRGLLIYGRLCHAVHAVVYQKFHLPGSARLLGMPVRAFQMMPALWTYNTPKHFWCCQDDLTGNQWNPSFWNSRRAK